MSIESLQACLRVSAIMLDASVLAINKGYDTCNPDKIYAALAIINEVAENLRAFARGPIECDPTEPES